MAKIFITGGTGFLGGAVAARLLEQDRVSELLLLVRATSAAEAWKRMANRLRSFNISESKLAHLKPENFLLGDISHLDDFVSDPRLREVTHVINCAAVTSFGNNPKIWPINVEATMAFADAARRWPKLSRFLHVGTAMACGVQAALTIDESFESDDQANHLVPYTKSKAAVEARMREELPDLPRVVARPSIVVGHSQLGCQPSPSIFWVFRMAHALREFLCRYEDRIDVVPVDYCAEALITLATKERLRHDRYHISAGTTCSNTMHEIDEEIARTLGVPISTGYRQSSFEQITARHEEFENLLGALNSRLMLRAIKLYGSFASLNILFDNRRLLEEGISPPPRFTDYIGTCLRSCGGTTIAQQMKVDFK